MRSALIADVVPLTEKRKADKTQVQAAFPLDWDDHQSTTAQKRQDDPSVIEETRA
jgi:hypothetical protein